jgi:hypothetical protein
VLDHLDDVVSDFSVFHRVDDVTALPGPVFFTMANRLAAYAGVIQARFRADDEGAAPAAGEPMYGDAEPRYTAPAGPPANPGAAAPGEPVDAQGRRIVPATRQAMMADPELRGLISFGVGGG